MTLNEFQNELFEHLQVQDNLILYLILDGQKIRNYRNRCDRLI